MAMLAHGGALLNALTGIGGIVVALIIYLVQKDKSPWVAFQALQSLIYQIVVSVIFWLAFFVSLILMSILIGCLTLPVSIVLGLAAIVYSLYAAYRVYEGFDFRFPIIGDWLAQQMPPLSPPPIS